MTGKNYNGSTERTKGLGHIAFRHRVRHNYWRSLRQFLCFPCCCFVVGVRRVAAKAKAKAIAIAINEQRHPIQGTYSSSPLVERIVGVGCRLPSDALACHLRFRHCRWASAPTPILPMPAVVPLQAQAHPHHQPPPPIISLNSTRLPRAISPLLTLLCGHRALLP